MTIDHATALRQPPPLQPPSLQPQPQPQPLPKAPPQGGAELVSRAHRATRCRELAEAGFLVARIVPLFERDEAPAEATLTTRQTGISGPLRRGELREALEGAVEISLALRGALPPGVELDAPPETAARDQLYRVRKLGAAGLCLVLPELRKLADAHGTLDAADSKSLEVWRSLSAEGPVVVLLDEGDRAIQMLAPRPLGEMFAERRLPQSWPDDARSLLDQTPAALVATVATPAREDSVDAGWDDCDEDEEDEPVPAPLVVAEEEDAAGAAPTRPGKRVMASEPDKRVVMASDLGKRVMASDPLMGLDIDIADAAPVAAAEDAFYGRRASSRAIVSDASAHRRPSRPRVAPEVLLRYCTELEAAEGPRPVSAVEELFRTRYTPLLEAVSGGFVDARTERVVNHWRANFEKSYGEGFQTMRVTGRRPNMVLDVPEVASRIARQHGARAVQLLMVDGMRYDLGQRVQRELDQLLAGRAQCVEQPLFWSALPTVTPVQLHLLARGPRALREEAPSEREPVIQRDRSVATLRRVRIGQRDLLKLDLCEARMREAGPGFEPRMSALAEEVADVIAHSAENLSARTLLFVFGDHGFYLPIGGPDATGPAEQGNATPEEVFVSGQAWLLGE